MSVDTGRGRFRGASRLARRPQVEGLEGRQLLTTAAPDIAMLSATTLDSQSVTISYEVRGEVQQPVRFTIERSADAQLDPGDTWIGSATVNPTAPGSPTLDQAGHPALAPGEHQLTITIPGGLPPNPQHPFVLVSADSGRGVTESDEGNNVASFRTHVIGVITHGGLQPSRWKVGGPPWEHRMAESLTAEGYDAVVPFNWVADSGHAGAARRQVPRLESMVLQAAGQFPPGDVVDLHFIGHSEGAVINSLAIERLQSDAPPQVQAGFIKETMLDPHGATNGVQGNQYSTSGGLLGYIAKMTINTYQAKAKDPGPFVPANVDDAEVFYQHTPVSQTYGSNHGYYNLWGQVPVRGEAKYYNLTATGLSHAGKFGVMDWYQVNVVPALGDGAPFVASSALTGSLRGTPPGGVGTVHVADTHRPIFEGSAAPNARVTLLAVKGETKALEEIGTAVADDRGRWALRARPLTNGRFRVLAMSNVPAGSEHARIHMRPTAWFGQLVVNAAGPFS